MAALTRWRRLVDGNHGSWRGAVRSLLGEADYLSGRLDGWLLPPSREVRRLVFVCLGNINRSAFAEGVARSLGVPAVSIGLSTSTGAPATARALQRAALHGIDLSRHQATDIGDHQAKDGDLLLAMEVRHVHRLIACGVAPRRIVLLGHWATPHRIHLHDPHTLGESYYATCFTLIESAVRRLSAALGTADAEEQAL